MNDRTWEKEVMGRYLTNVLQPLLKKYLADLQRVTERGGFRNIAHPILDEAKTQFLLQLEATGFERISKYLKFAFCSYTASFVNAELPEDFLFIVALVHTEDGGKMFFVVIDREPVKRKFVILNKESYPLFVLEDLDLGDTSLVDLNYMRLIRNPEDLMVLADEPDE